MKNVYIAFSIHGSNTFITATKSIADLELDAMLSHGGFFRIVSRRVNRTNQDIKLGWNRLNTIGGTPLRSPIMVVQCFNELEKFGWTVDKKAFIERHWKKKG